MSDDLITSLRALAAAQHSDLTVAADAADRIERLTRERDEALAEVERLMRDAKSLEGIIDSLERRIDGPDGLLAKVERLSRERDEARAALKPFASLFLWPDDLDSSSAADIRAEEDWNEAENDARSDDVWVRRAEIRAARKAVKAKP